MSHGADCYHCAKYIKRIESLEAENARLQSGIQRERDEIIEMLEKIRDADCNIPEIYNRIFNRGIDKVIAKIKERNNGK